MTNLVNLHQINKSTQLKLEYITKTIELINEIHKSGKKSLNRGFTQTITTMDGTEYTFTVKRKVK